MHQPSYLPLDTIATPSKSSPTCLVCGGSQAKLRFVQRGYPVFRCGGCGLEFVSPIPGKAELAAYYDRGYSVPLERYAATYEDAWYGDIGLTLEQGKLVMKFSRTPSLVGDLEHWQHDTFVVRWRDRELRADAFVTFALNPDGSVDQAKMRAVSAATDFSFDFQDLLLRPKKPGG